MNFRQDNNLPKRYNPLRDESSFMGESSELIKLKAEINADLDAMNGFIEGGVDDFSQNTPTQENNTVTYSLYNPTTTVLNVDLYGFDSANFSTVPVNPPPTIQSALIAVPPPGSLLSYINSFCTANNTLYIVDKANQNVVVWDCINNVFTVTIAFPPGLDILVPCYCPTNNQMYVACGTSPSVYRIDCNTNTIIGLPIPITNAFTNDFGALVYNSNKNSMYGRILPTWDWIEISCVSNSQVAFIPTGIVLGNGTSFNPSLNRIYAADGALNQISVLDCTTNILLAPIPIPFALGNKVSNCYCTFNNSIYQLDNTGIQYVIIDCATSVVSPINGTGVNGTGSITYNPINNLIYITGTITNDYGTLDVVTNIVVLTTPLPAGAPFIAYNQYNNSLYVTYQATSFFSIITPLFAPTVTITMPGGVTPAMIYNDTQDKPFVIRGVRIITDNPNQWNNNLTFSNTSYTGKVDSKQWQPLNYISPTNPNSTIVDATDLSLGVQRGPNSTAINFAVEPLTSMVLLFTVGRSLDSSTVFSQQNKDSVDNTTAIRFTGNPIADIFLGKMTKEEIAEQESKYSSTEYANYPRETGNPIADIALLRNYGIQGI